MNYLEFVRFIGPALKGKCSFLFLKEVSEHACGNNVIFYEDTTWRSFYYERRNITPLVQTIYSNFSEVRFSEFIDAYNNVTKAVLAKALSKRFGYVAIENVSSACTNILRQSLMESVTEGEVMNIFLNKQNIDEKVEYCRYTGTPLSIKNSYKVIQSVLYDDFEKTVMMNLQRLITSRTLWHDDYAMLKVLFEAENFSMDEKAFATQYHSCSMIFDYYMYEDLVSNHWIFRDGSTITLNNKIVQIFSQAREAAKTKKFLSISAPEGFSFGIEVLYVFEMNELSLWHYIVYKYETDSIAGNRKLYIAAIQDCNDNYFLIDVGDEAWSIAKSQAEKFFQCQFGN